MNKPSVSERIKAINEAQKRPVVPAQAPTPDASAPPAEPPRLGQIAPLIEAEPPFVRCYRIDRFFGPGDRPILAIGIRVNRKRAEDASVAASHDYAAKVAKGAGEGAAAAARDMDLLGDAKVIETLWRACREVVDPNDLDKGIGKHPAFPHTDWMRDNLDTDQLAALMHLYLETRKAKFRDRWDLSDDRIEALAEMAAKHADSDVPEVVLAPFGREQVTHAFVFVAGKLHDARRAVDVLLEQATEKDAEIDALKAQIAKLCDEADAAKGASVEPAAGTES